jgi:hypothetical protein
MTAAPEKYSIFSLAHNGTFTIVTAVANVRGVIIAHAAARTTGTDGDMLASNWMVHLRDPLEPGFPYFQMGGSGFVPLTRLPVYIPPGVAVQACSHNPTNTRIGYILL